MNRSSGTSVRGAGGRWLILAGILGIGLAAGWTGLFAWVDTASRNALYVSGNPDRAIALLERWSPWLGSPNSWRWLLAESYRKSGDRGRVKRITDSMAVAGVEPVRASGPMLLMEASSGAPRRVKENLGPLLRTYGDQGSEVLASMVQGLITQGDASTAKQTLRLWGELYEDDYQLEFWRGVLDTLNYDLDSAVAAFQKSIKINPNDHRARLELAEVLLEQAKFEEARTQCEWLIERSPENPKYLTSYSRCLLNLGFAEQAAEQLAKLRDTSKLRSPELSLVCETNLEAGRVEEASQQAAILLKRWPDALPYLQLQARCMAKLGNAAESEALFARAATSQIKRPEVDRMLEQLAIDGSNHILRRDLGEMMMNYLDPPGGVGFLQVTSRANPNDLRTHQLLATYYDREGELTAAEYHRRAIQQIELAQRERGQLERVIKEQELSQPNQPSNTKPTP